MNEKERKMVYSCHCQMWKLFVGLLLGAAVHIVHVQAVLSPDVTVTTDAWVDDQGRTTMTCSTTDTVDELEWLFSDISETDVNGATLIFKYASFAGSVTPGATIDATRFEFTGPGGSDNYPLVIKSVELGDERKYWCRILTASFDTIENNSTLRIRVKPTIILLEDPRTGMNYSSGSVEVIQGLNHFACIVQGIKPEAEFTWTLDSVTLSGSVETHVPNSEDARLVDSRSEQNFTVLGDSALACSAHNKQDGTTSPDKTVTVQLKPIKDPCEPNPCENGGTCTPKPSLDGYQCDCPPGTVEPNCTASTTPESPAKSTTIGGPGPSTPTEVSTTGFSTTMVSTSTDPLTTGSTTWMATGGTDQLNTRSTTPLVPTSTGPEASDSTPIFTSKPTPIVTTNDVDRGGSSDGLTTGQIVGICVGAIALVAILLVLTLCIFCRESLSKQCSCLQCKSSVNPEKEGGTKDKEALELNGGSTSKEKEEG